MGSAFTLPPLSSLGALGTHLYHEALQRVPLHIHSKLVSCPQICLVRPVRQVVYHYVDFPSGSGTGWTGGEEGTDTENEVSRLNPPDPFRGCSRSPHPTELVGLTDLWGLSGGSLATSTSLPSSLLISFRRWTTLASLLAALVLATLSSYYQEEFTTIFTRGSHFSWELAITSIRHDSSMLPLRTIIHNFSHSPTANVPVSITELGINSRISGLLSLLVYLIM